MDEENRMRLTSMPQLARQTHANCVPLIKVRTRVLTVEVLKATPAALGERCQRGVTNTPGIGTREEHTKDYG